MAIYPVILCGGAGNRLWPASRPARPKQFIDLISDMSLFQETVRRVAPLADGSRVVIVAGRDHREYIEAQLSALGIEGDLILEPLGRDSAPAMAAAALWIEQIDAGGTAVFVASDHYIPDASAFREAVIEAVAAAEHGRIVTMGMTPTSPSPAYGYIQPESFGLSRVRRFVEKPDQVNAERYLAEGYLWNSGNFIVPIRTFLTELEAFAPDVLAAVRAAMPGLGSGVHALDPAFASAPKISIDYAVMEKSDKVWVLPAAFEWSDLGAWDAVAATGQGARGVWVGRDSDGCLVRAAPGMVVATAGVSNLAIVAERDAVLVCSLDRAQEVKGLVERLGRESPVHLEAPAPAIDTPLSRVRTFSAWIQLNALPLWAALGVEEDGGFVESLDRAGRPFHDFRRARVQARQAWVYSVAGGLGWAGPWRALVERGLARFEQTNLRSDGLYRTRIDRGGRPLDETAYLYDQAFALLAFAAAAAAGVQPDLMQDRARRLFTALEPLRLDAGGWREAGAHPYQANAHMHLLEACQAWETLEPDGVWRAASDAIVALARRSFIDPGSGTLREFYDASWRPAAGDDGRLIEPGHQFEWAWLLTRWGRRRGDPRGLAAALALHAAGMAGIDPHRGVAIDALNDDLSMRSARARLWPQTERLKAALVLAETADEPERHRLLAEAGDALAGLQGYLETTGLWRDTMDLDGRFVDEPAPASSLYHIMAAYQQTLATAEALPGAFDADPRP